MLQYKLIYFPYYAEDFYKPLPKKTGIIKKFPSGFNLVFAGKITRNNIIVRV